MHDMVFRVLTALFMSCVINVRISPPLGSNGNHYLTQNQSSFCPTSLTIITINYNVIRRYPYNGWARARNFVPRGKDRIHQHQIKHQARSSSKCSVLLISDFVWLFPRNSDGLAIHSKYDSDQIMEYKVIVFHSYTSQFSSSMSTVGPHCPIFTCTVT